MNQNQTSPKPANAEQPSGKGLDETPCSPSDYDAGLLNNFGGGDVGWWQDYLRAEIGRANEYWKGIIDQRFTRVWAMPSSETFSVPPMGDMVKRYLRAAKVSVDPFARNKRWATHTNDLNPATEAEHHMDAEEFLYMLRDQGVRCDLAILDPPYSPRQISECYKAAGLSVGMKETQNAALYSRVKHALAQILTPEAIVLSFGWNSCGMGKKYGMEIIEMMNVCHGGAHNDTICIAEKQEPRLL